MLKVEIAAVIHKQCARSARLRDDSDEEKNMSRAVVG
jgi:hypothetical protein